MFIKVFIISLSIGFSSFEINAQQVTYTFTQKLSNGNGKWKFRVQRDSWCRLRSRRKTPFTDAFDIFTYGLQND